jgi:hypothetical protein
MFRYGERDRQYKQRKKSENNNKSNKEKNDTLGHCQSHVDNKSLQMYLREKYDIKLHVNEIRYNFDGLTIEENANFTYDDLIKIKNEFVSKYNNNHTHDMTKWPDKKRQTIKKTSMVNEKYNY